MDYCDDVECQYYKQGICISDDRCHSADRFCTTGRRRPKDETTNLMRAGEPTGYKRNGKWVRN